MPEKPGSDVCTCRDRLADSLLFSEMRLRFVARSDPIVYRAKRQFDCFDRYIMVTGDGTANSFAMSEAVYMTSLYDDASKE